MITLHFNNTTLDVQESDNSYRYRTIMQKPKLFLNFSLAEWVDIPVGAWCEYQAEKYYLNTAPNIKKQGERNIEYSLTLGTDEDKLGFYKMRNTADNRLKYSMCATPEEFIREIVTNLNRRFGNNVWSVGDCIESLPKTVEFNHIYIDAALQSVADTFETEWEITHNTATGTNTIHLRKLEYFKENPLPLSYGRGNGFVPGVGRTTASDEQPIKRLYVQGGEDNIDRSTYGSAELLLPKSQTLVYEGRTYQSDPEGLYIERVDVISDAVKEDSLDCSEIYPKREGSVSSVTVVDAVNNLYDFVDNSIPADLDFKDYIIEGETPFIRFQTGMLAGEKDFEFIYHHDTRRFEIVPQEIDGRVMPGGDFIPAVDDTYAVFGIMLPDAYICNNDDQTGASWDMFREAARHLYENEDQKFTFTGTLQGLYVKRNWITIGGHLKMGAYIRFSDAQFAPNGTDIRIVGIKDFITNPYAPTIELSNNVSGGQFASAMRDIKNAEVVIEDTRKGILSFTKRRFRDAQETMAMLENSMLNFSGSINPITVNTMGMLVGDESLQFRCCNLVNGTLVPADPLNITYNASGHPNQLHVPLTYIQHMTLGINTISSSHKQNEYLVWSMAEYLSPTLTDADKKYYLYAKVSKSYNTTNGLKLGTGTFIISETAIELNEVSGYYHLLMGILNSEYEGERSYASLYGYTEILPGRITTDIIISSNGETYFDLLNGEIGGNITFVSRNGSKKNVTDVEQTADEAKDAIDNLDIGMENLIPKQYLLDWNSIRIGTTAEGSDEHGNYLLIDNAKFYTYIRTSNVNDIFQNRIAYKENTQYCFKIKWDGTDDDYYGMSITFYYKDETSEYVGSTGKGTEPIITEFISAKGKTIKKISGSYQSGDTKIYEIQLTEGNKMPQGWVVAKEDFQAKIDEATDAAETAQAAINTLNSDSVFSIVEKKTIRTEWENIGGVPTGTQTEAQEYNTGSYGKVVAMANGTTVSTANLLLYHNNLMSHLNGQTCRLYTNENTSGFNRQTLSTFFTTYYNEEIAVTKAVQEYYTNHAIDDIEIGGNNLVRGTDKLLLGSGTWDSATWRKSLYGTLVNINIEDAPLQGITSGLRLTNSASGHTVGFAQDGVPNIIDGSLLTMSCWIKASQNCNVSMQAWYVGGQGGIKGVDVVGNNKWTKYYFTAIPYVQSGASIPSCAFLYLNTNYCSIDVCGIKLEKGNKPTDWSLASEDVQAVVKKYEYLADALQDEARSGISMIDGGLLLTALLQLLDPSGVITAGFSGLLNDPTLLWGGGTYEQALALANNEAGATKIPFLIRKDGTGNIGCFNVFNDTNKGSDNAALGQSIKINTADGDIILNREGIFVYDEANMRRISIISGDVTTDDIPVNTDFNYNNTVLSLNTVPDSVTEDTLETGKLSYSFNKTTLGTVGESGKESILKINNLSIAPDIAVNGSGSNWFYEITTRLYYEIDGVVITDDSNLIATGTESHGIFITTDMSTGATVSKPHNEYNNINISEFTKNITGKRKLVVKVSVTGNDCFISTSGHSIKLNGKINCAVTEPQTIIGRNGLVSSVDGNHYISIVSDGIGGQKISMKGLPSSGTNIGDLYVENGVVKCKS